MVTSLSARQSQRGGDWFLAPRVVRKMDQKTVERLSVDAPLWSRALGYPVGPLSLLIRLARTGGLRKQRPWRTKEPMTRIS